jgi:hypothetical protein
MNGNLISNLGGLKYKLNNQEYIIDVCKYDSGGAYGIDVSVFVEDPPHSFWEPEARLTHNLGKEDLQKPYTLREGEIFVKVGMIKYQKEHLDHLGFTYTGIEIGYGPYDAKAQVWVLGRVGS